MLEQKIAIEIAHVARNLDGVALTDKQVTDIADLIVRDQVPPHVFNVEVSEFETLANEDDWSDINNAISNTIEWFLQQEAEHAAEDQMNEAVELITRKDGTRISLEDVVRVEVLEHLDGQSVTDKQLENVVNAIVNYTHEFVLPDMVSDKLSEDEQDNETERGDSCEKSA